MITRLRNAFLVVEPDVLVADDLRETLQGLDPEAAVHMARSAEEARALLEALDGLSAAFLRLPSAELRSGPIPREVERRGGRVVVLDTQSASPGEAPRDQARWIHTGRPYGARTIAAVLQEIGLMAG